MVGLLGTELQRHLAHEDGTHLEVDPANLISNWQKEWPYLIYRELRGGGFLIGTFGIDGQIGTDDDYFEYWPPGRPIE